MKLIFFLKKNFMEKALVHAVYGKMNLLTQFNNKYGIIKLLIWENYNKIIIITKTTN